MAINDFVSTVWSETLYKQLDKEYIAVKNCNREFEGSIKSCGDTVKICGIDPITVFSYTKNTDMDNLQTLDSSSRTLTIDQAKAFNFQIDDIDKAQQSPKIMTEAMKEAASALADAADNYVFSLYSQASASNTITKASLTDEDVIDTLLETREKLLTNNVSSNTATVLEVPPAFAAKILKAKILQSTGNEDAISKGYIGSFVGFDIYVSNNIKSATSNSALYYKCFARTQRAIAFAEQVNSVEAYRPEKRFADAVKGIHLYGAKLIYPDELVLLNVNLA